MEDKKLTEKESLELISQMIRNTQRKMEENSGTMFLIWGYMTVFTTLLVWMMLMLTGSYQWQWLWFLLPIGSSIGSLIFYKRREKKPYAITYIDRMTGYVWKVLGITAFLLSMISIFIYKIPILFIVVIVLGAATTLTVLIIQYRFLVISGITGMSLSVAFLFLGWSDQMLLFALIFIIMMIIPGHMLNYLARKENKERG